MTVNPSYTFASLFNDSPDQKKARAPDPERKLRNSWFSKRLRCRVGIVEGADGRCSAGYSLGANQPTFLLNTLDASHAWGIEQEHHALELLASLVKPHIFKMYLLTGTLPESSKRSGLMYIFRKLRPTLVLKGDNASDTVKAICTLCMHPIGLYDDSWGGAMCPTDDVICHLMLMRGDEHAFWKRCNQHPIWHPNSGL